MAKLCGFIGATDAPVTVDEQVQALLQAMRHGEHQHEHYEWFARGGIATLTSDPLPEHTISWDTPRQQCLALAGYTITNAQASPAAALVIAYQEHGEHVLATLNGDFAFALYDTRTGTLTIANSKYGFCPLYYYADARGCWFASEVKALLHIVPQPALDWEGAADFFYAGHMLGGRTLFQGIAALEPGQVLTYVGGKLSRRQYVDFTQTPVMDARAVSTAQVARHFQEAIVRQRDTRHADTVLLSGGFDSRLILGALRRQGVSPRVISLEHANEHNGADGRYATQIARKLGLACEIRRTRHNFYASPDCLEVFYILDGMAPTWDLFISQVYGELDPNFGVVWEGMALGSGLGAAHQQSGNIATNLTEFLDKRALHRRLLQRILTPEAFQALDYSFHQRLRAEIDRIPVSENQYGHFVMKHRIRRRIAPNPHKLFAAKVQPRTPGTDLAFLDYVMAVPTSIRRHHHLYRAVLKEHFPELATVPIISGGEPMPLDNGFKTRLHQYTKGVQSQVKYALRRFNTKRLINSTLRRTPSREEREKTAMMTFVLEQTQFKRPFYNTVQLQRMFAEYRGGNTLHHELFTLVFYIELWHQLFLEPSSLRADVTARERVAV